MIAQLQVRRGTNAQWGSANPILAAGEIGATTDAPFIVKMGDGVSTWTALLGFAIPDGGNQFEALAKSSGTNRDVGWQAVAIPSQVTVFNTAQTGTAWAKPTGCKAIHMVAMGSGGGGGAGRRGAAGTVRIGGNGGYAGHVVDLMIEAASVPANLYVSVGTAGAGGAAQTVDSTNGADGTAGLASFVSSSSSGVFATAAELALVVGEGGFGGLGGKAITSSNATSPPWGWESGGPGGQARDATADQPYNGGGGAGGSLSAANATSGLGSKGAAFRRGPYAWVGTASPASGAAGIAGSTSAARLTNVVAPGCGGSGGASHPSGVGGTGGAGDRGGGGGGGGASPNGSNSGAGAAGGVGFVIITAYF